MGWLKKIARVLNSSPPLYGAFVVDRILRSDCLRTQWLDEMKNTFVKDLQQMR
jgi:aspartate/tyrosine/aromatic aminotransferase